MSLFFVAPNIYHQALSHLISENAQDKSSGYYKLKPDMEIDHEAGKPPAFNMVPEPDQGIYYACITVAKILS